VTEPFESLGGGRYRVSGELGFETVPAIWEQSNGLLDGDGDPLVDLGAVTQVDSAGLALIIEWLRLARSRGKSIRFVAVPEGLKSLARISEVEGFL
jgi:phospholipid transport system transporter-binding protein